MAKTSLRTNNPHVQFVRGYPFPGSVFFKKEVLEEVMDYIPHPGDIIVSSYPKTGTTWLQYIVLQIVSKGNLFPDCEGIEKMFPFVEKSGVAVLNSLKPPRMYMHHMPYDLMKKNDKSKVLYIYRRPEDTFVSYYHFYNQLRETGLDFDQYFEDFLSGNVGYGDYFDHIMSYLMHKDDKNLLLVSYEKLHANRKGEISRIAKFLGEEYINNITADERILNKIIENTNFDHMKTNLPMAIPMVISENKGSKTVLKEIDFFRKGTVGDGKNELSTKHLKSLRDAARSVLKGTEVLKEWTEE